MTSLTRHPRYLRTLPIVAAFVWVTLNPTSKAAAQSVSIAPRQLITQPIDDTRRVTLAGNVRSEATPANDLGLVEDSLPLDHLLLQLNRPPSAQAAFDEYTNELTERNSPNYHKWLTAAQIGSRYGLAQSDIDKITAWLESNGFKINQVYPGRTVIDFSGNAGQVRGAFQTEIHSLDVNGVRHIANYSNPQVPAALASAIAGVVSLNNFRPHAMHKNALRPHSDYTFTSDEGTFQAVVPADLATIYNLNPLFSAGYSGKGQTIVVIEDTNVHSTSDWTKFRSTFGLSSFTSGSFTQVHPGGCTNPGTVSGNESEATLDAEWASAAAPNAAIELASCADTSTTFGGLIALANLVNAGSPPAIVSISYGECEAENGASANAAFNSTYEQAAAEGVSVFVSAGDEGAASCDADETNATHGIGVSGFASTPFNVAVGGTDFGDTYTGNSSSYWSSTNSSTYGSAKFYIREIPWNDSCASVLIATAATGSGVTYGKGGFCNSSLGEEEFLTTGAGSGGPSGCATGAPSKNGVVSGSCKGYGKPSWQALVGVPNDGVRDLPDVSLFASNGVWNHYYVYCDSDVADGGAACTGAPENWSGAGGTSFASPILAAIQSLVNQKTGERQGNPNPTYYQLAKTEYGATGSSSCNSSQGKKVSASCIFYDVTQGDIDVNCTGGNSCYKPSGSFGVLSTSNTAYDPAFGTTAGYDFATGIGSLNAYNLVFGW
jgi:subtilase family serine protease